MANPIDFYFDFSSPYGYLMSEKIDPLAAAHGRSVNWRPILLGVVYKTTGAVAMPLVPLKRPYALRDFERSARFLDVPLHIPEAFPIPTQHAARAFYWLEGQDPGRAGLCARCLPWPVRRWQDISQLEVVLDIGAGLGLAREQFAAALGSDAVKERLKAACSAAIDAQVFGSPFVIIDGEPFWGVDRLAQIERWLKEGGF